jgi:hypothetical protein
MKATTGLFLALTLIPLAGNAQGTAPGRSNAAQAADAARTALEDVRILRGINRVQLTADQAKQVLALSGPWHEERLKAEGAAAAQLAKATQDLRQALPKVEANPLEPVPAEGAYNQALQTLRFGAASSRRETAGKIAEKLPSILSPQQLQAAMTLAQEEMLEERLSRGGPGGQGAAANMLRELERLRAVSPEDYQRRRDMTARRQAMQMDRRGMREAFRRRREAGGQRQPGQRPQPPPLDPAAQQRMAAISAQLDQVRQMPPGLWQAQRERIATQMAREREVQSVQSRSPEELLRSFAESYLLQDRSVPAMKERFKLD